MSEQEQQQQEEVQQEQHQLSESEERASSYGWMPKEEWVAQGNSEEDWKPAKVFIEHGEMLGKIRSQSKELIDASNALRYMHEQSAKAYEKGYQTAITELRQQKREALAEGDLVKADELDEKIDATKDELLVMRARANQAIAAAPKVAPQVDPEHAEWVQRNPWYEKNQVLAKYADAAAIAFIQERNGQVTADQVRRHVEQTVRKEFPEKIGQVKRAPSPDGEGRIHSKSDSNKDGLDSKLSRVEAEMPDEHKQIMRTMMKATGMSKKDYLTKYAE